ncbi:DNA helicase MCM9 [Gracilariopsis chorda]|uniref:DNA helicase n=1 Tax=Gracilariopsis chorda TaxID=448386 RepID=A0A2V3IL43_9FLOR|nr:DNA helicase MCM9 [Gracilariopsis chorda]|eukprot:PXF42811.1 DNA helicase MCM9 [Gracilariopsis chorda]
MARHSDRMDHVKDFEDYLRRNCIASITEIAQAADDEAHYGVEIDLMSLEGSAPHAFTDLLSDPHDTLPQLEVAIQNVQSYLTDTPKTNVHARVCHLPATPAYVKSTVSVLRTRDIHKLISILGTVTRTGSVMLREEERKYVCSRCKHEFLVTGDISQRGAYDVPSRCPRPGEKPCYGTNFTPKPDELPKCQEYQEIKVQEKIQHLDVGSIPRSLIVVLTNDLADTVKPGDDVVVTGILHRRWNRNFVHGMRADVELMLLAFHVSSNNDHKSFLHVTEESRQTFAAHWSSRNPAQQLMARNLIIKSICPQIYGMYLLKLIVAMSLIGGVTYTDPSGTRIRGRTTSAGLTVTAVREPGTGEWMLDAGALVLADGGVCCIDEFDGIKQHDRGAIHEAMEQQTLSVAKAGLVCTLDTRATVLAAVNPKGGRVSTEIGTSGGGEDDVDEKDNLPITVGIASPLLSRFDVVLTLLDQKNEDWDRQLSDFILNGYKANLSAGNDVWSTDRVRQYLYYIKNNLKPRLSRQCQRILSTYYTLERASAKRNTARTTVRLLEALVRLAQAHARLMFRETATPMDAVFAIAAVEASSASQEVVGGMGALHAPFPENPRRDFENYCRFLVCKLGMEDEEIDFYGDDAPVEGL